MKPARTSLRPAAVLLAAVVAMTGFAAPAVSADTSPPLALNDFDQMLVLPSQNALIFDDQVNGVLVTDRAGHTLASIPEAAPADLALSPDNSTLYVARWTSHSIAAIDTTSWKQTAVYDTGKGIAPASVAFAAGRLWFAYNTGSTGGLGSIDPAAAVPTPVLHNLGGTNGHIVTSAAAPGLLVASFDNPNWSPTRSTIEVLDVASGTPRVTAQRDAPWGNDDLAISPDGKEVATAQYGVLQLSDLSPSDLYPELIPGRYAQFLTFSPDGTLAYAYKSGPPMRYSVLTMGPQSLLLRTYTNPPVEDGGGAIEALGFTPDGSQLLAVHSHGAPYTYSLDTLNGPEMADVTLGPFASIDPSRPEAGQAFQVLEDVQSAKGLAPDSVLHLTRTDAADPQGLALADLHAGGTGASPAYDLPGFTDTVPVDGPAQYKVTFDGDATHPPASTTLTLSIGGDTYHPVTPTRLLDTRTQGYVPQRGGWQTLQIRGNPAIAGNSSGAQAVVLNVTVTKTLTSGYLTAYPNLKPRPGTSNLNWPSANTTISNLVTVPVGTDGAVNLYYSSGTALIADVQGFYTDDDTGASLTSITPARLLDTRNAVGTTSRTPITNRTISVAVRGHAGVPSDAVAAVVNLTAVGSTAAGYIAAYPEGSATAPTVSNVNFGAAETVRAGLAIVPIGADGHIKIKVSGSTHVLADVSGYLTNGTNATELTPVAADRLLDTRHAIGVTTSTALPAGHTIALQITGRDGIPSGAKSVILNVTTTTAAKPGFLTAWADAQSRPNTSNLNWTNGSSIANQVIVPISTDGKVDLYVSATTHVIADAIGYYR